MPAVFANPYASRYQHISSPKIAQLRYKNIKFERRFRADLLVEKKILVENKALKKITNQDEAQLINYLKPKLSDFLLNLRQFLAHKGFAKLLDISTGMPAVFPNPYASRSQHISSQKIAQLRLKQHD